LNLKRFFVYHTAILLSIFCSVSAYAAKANETSEAYSFKMSVEKHLESKLNTVLREVTGIKQLVAIVKVEVKTEEKYKPSLPGIPTRKGPNDTNSKLVVKKLNVEILVDSDVSNELTTLAHNVAIDLVGYNPDRGDTLVIKNFQFMQGNSGVASILTPPHIYYVLLAIPLVVFLVAASMFFLNPYRNLKFSLQEIGVISKTAPSDTVTAPHSTPVLQNIPGSKSSAKPTDGDASSAAEDRLFGFLGSYSISDIMFALGDMDPEEISVALNYMDSALAAEVITRLDENVRKAAVEKLIDTKQLDQKSVKELEEKLKLKLTFRSGGDAKLASILENTDDTMRDSLMDSIEQTDSVAASRLGQRIRTLESIIRRAKPVSIDVLVRRFKPSEFARILASTPGDVQGKVLESLGKGASELMLEELKYAKPLTGVRLRNEKRRVVQELLALSEAGLVDESLEEDS